MVRVRTSFCTVFPIFVFSVHTHDRRLCRSFHDDMQLCQRRSGQYKITLSSRDDVIYQLATFLANAKTRLTQRAKRARIEPSAPYL